VSVIAKGKRARNAEKRKPPRSANCASVWPALPYCLLFHGEDGRPIVTLDEYQKAAARTLNPRLNDQEKLLDAAAGIAEEAGEVLAHVRKHPSRATEATRVTRTAYHRSGYRAPRGRLF